MFHKKIRHIYCITDIPICTLLPNTKLLSTSHFKHYNSIATLDCCRINETNKVIVLANHSRPGIQVNKLKLEVSKSSRFQAPANTCKKVMWRRFFYSLTFLLVTRS